MTYEVIENGPDSTDYTVASFTDDKGAGSTIFGRTGKDKAESYAKQMTEENAYLGYCYSVKKQS